MEFIAAITTVMWIAQFVLLLNAAANGFHATPKKNIKEE